MIPDGARHFEDFDGLTYLNCANHGPLPKVTAAAMTQAIALKSYPNRIPDHIYFTLTDRARAAVAPLVGAAPEWITLGTGESHGSSLAALGYPWRAGDEVVVASSDFPSNVYIWCNAARRFGGTARVVKPRRRAAVTEEILGAISPATRIVAVSLIDFGSGEVMDLERLGPVCAEQDILLVVDATQAAGIVPLDMRAHGIGVVCVAGYKWTLAPYGTGYAAVAPEWMDRLEPAYVTWTAAKGSENFNSMPRENWEWVPGARRYDTPEAASFVNVTGLATSAELITEIGLTRMHDHVTGLLEGVEQALPHPYRKRATPSRVRGPILSIEADDVPRVHRAYQALREAGFVVSLREDAVRVSPHIHNSERDLERLVQTLGAVT
jgi:selenocysteine lyase/cysteine desulfurase